MSRLSLLFFVTLWLVAQGTPDRNSNSPSMSHSPKDLSYLSVADDEMPELENFHTKQFGELRTVLSTIKQQFREIIEDLMSQVLNYIKEILKQLKVKILKKLSVFSVSDVLRRVFDGVTDLIEDPVPDYFEPVRDPSPVEPSFGYRPFSLASLLGGKSNDK